MAVLIVKGDKLCAFVLHRFQWPRGDVIAIVQDATLMAARMIINTAIETTDYRFHGLSMS